MRNFVINLLDTIAKKIFCIILRLCGSNSMARVPAFQAGCCEFESRLPLFCCLFFLDDCNEPPNWYVALLSQHTEFYSKEYPASYGSCSSPTMQASLVFRFFAACFF